MEKQKNNIIHKKGKDKNENIYELYSNSNLEFFNYKSLFKRFILGAIVNSLDPYDPLVLL